MEYDEKFRKSAEEAIASLDTHLPPNWETNDEMKEIILRDDMYDILSKIVGGAAKMKMLLKQVMECMTPVKLLGETEAPDMPEEQFDTLCELSREIINDVDNVHDKVTCMYAPVEHLEEVAAETKEKLDELVEQLAKWEKGEIEEKARFDTSISNCMKNALNSHLDATVETCLMRLDRRVDRNRNLMVFGFWEDKSSYFDEVTDVLRHIGVLTAIRDVMVVKRKGMSPDGKVVLRIVLDSSEQVNNILANGKSLKTYSSQVYIAKDMTFEERRRTRELVLKMKESIRKHPEIHWAIKDNTVVNIGTWYQ